MRSALDDSSLGRALLGDHAGGERHGAGLGVDLVEEGARGVLLQLVLGLDVALEDGAAVLALPSLALSGAHAHVDRVDLVRLEFNLLDLLLVLVRVGLGEGDLLLTLDRSPTKN